MSQLWDFGWFDLTRFEVDGPFAERHRFGHVLAEFLRDPISQRSFCTLPDPWGNSGGLHGPFPLATLAPEWYRPLPLDELQRRVAMTLDDPEFTTPPSRQQRAPVEAWLESARTRGDDLVALDAPAVPGVRVEWDVWLLFHEFVCFTPDREEMIVAVIGFD
ncbi:hypothetical protein KKD52_15005 [Myxococcota bacterium]|nr:hypothetical protein [Myxococcota bacterium]MBU1412042.1 hypothetical protein [Myxococcota bacterium]MBU1511661.1 hypothetical protein [Myxococcota bacterium]